MNPEQAARLAAMAFKLQQHAQSIMDAAEAFRAELLAEPTEPPKPTFVIQPSPKPYISPDALAHARPIRVQTIRRDGVMYDPMGNFGYVENRGSFGVIRVWQDGEPREVCVLAGAWLFYGESGRIGVMDDDAYHQGEEFRIWFDVREEESP